MFCQKKGLCLFFYWLQIAAKAVFALPLSFLEAIRNTINTFHMSFSFRSCSGHVSVGRGGLLYSVLKMHFTKG